MLNILGRIYGMFTVRNMGNIAVSMVSCFIAWIANNWTKTFMKNVGDWFGTAITASA